MRDHVETVAVSVLISVSASYGLFYLSTERWREESATHLEVARVQENLGTVAKMTADDVNKLNSRIDLHAKAMDYADLGKHWWCSSGHCERDKSNCERVAIDAKKLDPSIDAGCVPRRMAYCRIQNLGPCFPVLEVCKELGLECVGVE